MADSSSGDISSDNVLGRPPQNFQLKRDLSIADVDDLLQKLGRGGSGANGATFSGRYFASIDSGTEFSVLYHEDESSSRLNEESIAKILGAVRNYFLDRKEYVEIARNISTNNKEVYDYYNLLLTGDAKGNTDPHYQQEQEHQTETIERLHELVAIITESGEQGKQTYDTSIPTELQRLVGATLDESWKTVFGEVIQPLHEAELFSAPTLEFSGASYQLPVFRKFLTNWFEALFKDARYTDYFSLLAEQKDTFLLPVEAAAVSFPNQKNSADAEALKRLAEDLPQIIDGILGLKNAAKVMEPFAKKQTPIESGGEADEANEVKEEEEVVLQDQTSLTLQQALQLTEEALVEQLYTLLTIEQQIVDLNLSPALSSSQKSFLQQQVRTEIKIQLIPLIAIQSDLLNPANKLFDEKTNTILAIPFYEWLESYPIIALSNGYFSSFQREQFAELGRTIIQSALPFSQVVNEDVLANEDLGPKAVDAKKLEQLVAEHQQQLADNPEYDSRLFAQTEARLEGVLLAYLQNQGLDQLSSITDIDGLDPTLRNQFRGEIATFLNNLSTEEKLQLKDPAFAAIIAARFNRQILLGRFTSSNLYSRIHSDVQAQLTQQQADIQKSVNAITGENNLLPLSGYGPDYINGLSIEAFNAAFGQNLPLTTSSEQFARYKQQQIEKWRPSYQQASVIQRLMLLYGEDFEFIRALNTPEKLNQIFGLNLPNSLSQNDIIALQNSLINYWQLEITQQLNKRNFEFNTTLQAGKNLSDLDPSDPAVLEYFKQLQAKRVNRPLLGGGPGAPGVGKDDYAFDDERVLSAHQQLYQGSEAFGEYYDKLYVLDTNAGDLKAMMALDQRWKIALLLNQQLQAENAAQQLAFDEATIAAMMAAQLGQTQAYSAKEIQKQGLLSRFAQRFGQQSPAQKAQKVMDKAKTEALLKGAAALDPTLGTILKVSEGIKSLTGLSTKDQLLGVGGLAIAAITNFIQNVATLGGAIGGGLGFLVGGGFTPLSLVTVPTGAAMGNALFDTIGINRSLFDLGGTASNLGSSVPATVSSGVGSGGFGGGAAFGNVAGASVGGFAVLTVVAGITATTTIYSALLLPEQLDISKAVVVRKTASPRSSENPTTISYTVTITPAKNVEVTIKDVSDTFRYSFNQEARDADNLGGAQPTNQPNNSEYTAFLAELQTLSGQTLPPEGVSFEYEADFGSEFAHGKIMNTVTVSFNAVASSESSIASVDGGSASASSSSCFGECPNFDGCFEFIDPANVEGGIAARITGAETNTSSQVWDEVEKERVLLAFSNRAGTSATFTSLACDAGNIKLHRLSGSAYGGWKMSANDIGLYDLAFVDDYGLEYTLIHELGHIIDARNGGKSNGLLGSCAPTYPATCNHGEPFAEAVALYVVHSTYDFSRGINFYDFPNELPDQYEYIQREIFPDAEFR